MKKLLFCLSGFLFGNMVQAQNFHLNLFLGTSNYQGDLQDKRFTFSQSHLAGGLGLSYDLTDHFAVSGGFILGKVSGDDKKGRNKNRNLNFSSGLTEGNIELQYYITPLLQHSLTPYVFAGIAVYHFDPYTYDALGKKYFLKPLSTEGEGFVAGVKDYKLTQLAIPFGGGVKLNLSDNINVGFELGFRKLSTDYLDDVSGKYVDQGLLLSSRGAKAVDLAFRGDELKTGLLYPAAGGQRGSPKAKDWYYFTGLTLSFRLGAGNGGSGGSHSQWACPRNVL
jgi:opacity protein-like surface antigen